MGHRKEKLGHLELDVLRYVSDHHPLTVREVADHFANHSGQARTTVLTVMERLRGKGYLTRRKIEGRQQYSPTIPKAELLQGIVSDFVDGVLAGNVSPFVAHLTCSAKLSADEIRKLEQLLKRIKSRESRSKS